MENLLEVQHLNKKIGRFQLSDINFSIAPGYITGLIGRNGAGKTTLIHTLLNLYKKDSGDISVCGFSMEKQERQVKDRIGFVLDSFLFEETMSVAANGKYFGSFYTEYDHGLFLKFCRRFELDPSIKTGKLSKGQKTRFQLAFALSHNAKLFLMDEPSSGLDPLMRKELLGYMQEIVESGTRSVLFSTHLTADLDQIGDYIILIDRGHIFMNWDKETLRDHYRIVYGTREEVEAFQGSFVLCKLYDTFHSSILVEKPLPEHFGNLTVKVPTLEELMYYLQKGGVIQ